MDLKFSFGASNPLPLATSGHDHGAASAGSSSLELRVGRLGDSLTCSALSGDGVEYARAEKTAQGQDPESLLVAVRSVIARVGAELPEPLIGSVTEVTLDLGDASSAVLSSLGDTADDAFQARTGITVGTPIRLVT